MKKEDNDEKVAINEAAVAETCDLKIENVWAAGIVLLQPLAFLLPVDNVFECYDGNGERVGVVALKVEIQGIDKKENSLLEGFVGQDITLQIKLSRVAFWSESEWTLEARSNCAIQVGIGFQAAFMQHFKDPDIELTKSVQVPIGEELQVYDLPGEFQLTLPISSEFLDELDATVSLVTIFVENVVKRSNLATCAKLPMLQDSRMDGEAIVKKTEQALQVFKKELVETNQCFIREVQTQYNKDNGETEAKVRSKLCAIL